MNHFSKIIFACLLLIYSWRPACAQVQQKNISRVDQMPYLPKPLQIIDYKNLALNFDRTVYDFNAKGKFWPLIWIDSSMRNFPQPVAGI